MISLPSQIFFHIITLTYHLFIVRNNRKQIVPLRASSDTRSGTENKHKNKYF
ncbi:hypothetical protein M109_4536 [Bacteroides fragilis str. 3397 N2]|nr:hypothetical protein M109_4536 [Bacteroides fragilis str. 3397 N2]EXZ51325.1 hypothetical protein M108_4705 [Bacteroides fragilis str. 3397 T14]